MQKSFVILIGLFIQTICFSQNNTTSVEKSLFGIQTGLIGVWINNELKIINSVSLRSELGLNLGLIGGDFVGNTKSIVLPNFSLEPRWYYNLNKRKNKGRSTTLNSGNFLTIANNFYPRMKENNFFVPTQLSIIPKWGIRRVYSNFTYEVGFGLGKIFYLEDVPPSLRDVAVDFHLRIGYTF